jgi:hypothetical protein
MTKIQCICFVWLADDEKASPSALCDSEIQSIYLAWLSEIQSIYLAWLSEIQSICFVWLSEIHMLIVHLLCYPDETWPVFPFDHLVQQLNL